MGALDPSALNPDFEVQNNARTNPAAIHFDVKGLTNAAYGAGIAAASGPTLTTLVSFSGADGDQPSGGLFADSTGNLFGVTEAGGADDCGTVFEIAKTESGYASEPTTLVSFTDADGKIPTGKLIADAAGDLFGTTIRGGADEDGTVFEIVKTQGGYSSSPTTLASFTGARDGALPDGGLIMDAAGDIFGTTTQGGAKNRGTVFEIVKTANGYAHPSILASFTAKDGASANGGLIADAAGDLFGTTAKGGTYNVGTVFELVKTQNGYAKALTTLVSFTGADGTFPNSLIADAAGDLFGTTNAGGVKNRGTVFEIVKTQSGYASAPITLVSFNGANGKDPNGLILDGVGNLFGTTTGVAANNAGTVFEIAKTQTGYASTPTTLARFTGANGAGPGGLTADAAGDLFGTTQNGGANQQGTAFEITDSGFVPLDALRLHAAGGPVPSSSKRAAFVQAMASHLLSRAGEIAPTTPMSRQELSTLLYRSQSHEV